MSTNYYNTLIEIADDSPTATAIAPDLTRSTVASQQFSVISEHPYTYTSDDVIFMRVADKESIPDEQLAEARETYFQKGRACLRASPLPKTHGWGIHANEEGKIALVAAGSDTYRALQEDESVKKVKAMRRTRA